MRFAMRLVPGIAVILVSLCSGACSVGQNAPDGQAALDKAFRAGILTADEYAAKKAALASRMAQLAALNKALAAGVLTQDEYAAKKAALLGSPSPVQPTATALAASAPAASAPAASPAPTASNESSLNQTADQAAADHPPQLAAAPAARPAPISAGAATGDGHTYKMKMVQAMDQHGFERPMASVSMLIPTDWQFQGATTWNIKDSCNTIQTSLKATGPDGKAYEVFPAYAWSWADDPTFLRQGFAQKAQFGTHACDVQPPVSAADYAKQIMGKIRPGARIAAIEPAPQLMERLQQQARQTEQSAARYRLQQKVRPDVIKARVKYSVNGQAVEEWVVVAVMVTASTAPSYSARAMRMVPATSYTCSATMMAERAPQGQLDASARFFDMMASTYHVNAAWQSRVNGNALAVQQIELKGVRDRSAIVTKNAEDIRNIQREGYENQQRVQDQSAKDFSQVIRGVESYRNPGTGETVELDSNYGHAWVNGTGTYLLTDQPSFNPNTVSTESWTPLEHVKP